MIKVQLFCPEIQIFAISFSKLFVVFTSMKKNYMFTETHRDRVYVYLPSKEIVKRLALKRTQGIKSRDLILTALLQAGKNGLSQKLLVN
jgi:hypothetical protein